MPAAKLGLFQIIIILLPYIYHGNIIIIIIIFSPRIIFLLSFIALSSYLCSVSHSIRVTLGAQLHCLQQIPLSQPASRSTVSKATHKRAFDNDRFPLTNGPHPNCNGQCHLLYHRT